MKTAFKYIRVSTENQDTLRQHTSIDSYCANNNIKIIETFEEKESGKNKVRKALTAMMKACITKKPDYIIIDELSRLGRTAAVLTTIEELNELKICVYMIKENIFSLNEDGTENTDVIINLYVNTGYARNELIKSKARMKGGIMSAAERGQFSGGGFNSIPYGYEIEIRSINSFSNKQRSFLAINEFEAGYIREIFKRSLAGEGVRKLANWLNTTEFKTRTGVLWNDNIIYGIIKNKLYTGIRELNGQSFKSYPEIITPETFEQLQQLLKSRNNASENHKIYEHLFNRGLIVCGVCGKNYYARKSTPKPTSTTSTKANVYRCQSKTGMNSNCSNYGVNIDKLQKTVQDVILNYLPKQIQQAIDTTEIDENIIKLNEDITENKTALAAETKKESQLLDALLNGIFSQEIIKIKMQDLNQRKEQTSQYITQKEKELANYKVLKDNALNLPKMIKKMKNEGINKSIIHKLIEKIVILPSTEKISTAKNEKTSLIKILFFGGNEISYLLSQRSEDIKLIEVSGSIFSDVKKYDLLKGVSNASDSAKNLVIN